jgi:hypothetical protein
VSELARRILDHLAGDGMLSRDWESPAGQASAG